eukprot:snap_masked-scaffold_16-processed-gene-6.93-mRNA-1 protein AED:1.00 eAED:1.00 QI:0/-1/0/0/-1/1/1/0/757
MQAFDESVLVNERSINSSFQTESNQSHADSKYFEGNIFIRHQSLDFINQQDYCDTALVTGFGVNQKYLKKAFINTKEVLVLADFDQNRELPGIKKSSEKLVFINCKGLSADSIQHAKLIILFYKNYCRIIISTQNPSFAKFDNAHFILDLKKREAKEKIFFINNLSSFLTKLIPKSSFCFQSNKRLKNFIKVLENDYSGYSIIDKKYKLIQSIPGVHKENTSYGLYSLKNIFSEKLKSIKTYSSSLGNGNIFSEFSKHLKISENKIVCYFPTLKQIVFNENIRRGVLTHFPAEKVTNFKEIHWVKKYGCFPHFKIIIFQDEKNNFFTYLGSHNFTTNAWGISHQKGVLDILTYELGVLCLNTNVEEEIFIIKETRNWNQSFIGKLFTREEYEKLSTIPYSFHRMKESSISALAQYDLDKIYLFIFDTKENYVIINEIKQYVDKVENKFLKDLKLEFKILLSEVSRKYVLEKRINSTPFILVCSRQKIVFGLSKNQLSCCKDKNLCSECNKQIQKLQSILTEKQRNENRHEIFYSNISEKYDTILFLNFYTFNFQAEKYFECEVFKNRFLEYWKKAEKRPKIFIIQSIYYIGLVEYILNLPENKVKSFLEKYGLNYSALGIRNLPDLEKVISKEKFLEKAKLIEKKTEVTLLFSFCFHHPQVDFSNCSELTNGCLWYERDFSFLHSFKDCDFHSCLVVADSISVNNFLFQRLKHSNQDFSTLFDFMTLNDFFGSWKNKNTEPLVEIYTDNDSEKSEVF